MGKMGKIGNPFLRPSGAGFEWGFPQLLRYTAGADAGSTTPMPSIWDWAQ